MSKAFEKSFRAKAGPILAEHGFTISPMESGLHEGTDDAISFIDKDGRESLVGLQVSNSESGGSYVVVGKNNIVTRELASGWLHSSMESMQSYPEHRKTDVDGIVAEVVKVMTECDFAVDPATGDDPKAIDHPLLAYVIDTLEEIEGVGIGAVRIESFQAIVAVSGTSTLRFEAANGEIAIVNDDAEKSIVRFREGKDAFRAVIREAIERDLVPASSPTI
jgi:hypothetical protein